MNFFFETRYIQNAFKFFEKYLYGVFVFAWALVCIYKIIIMTAHLGGTNVILKVDIYFRSMENVFSITAICFSAGEIKTNLYKQSKKYKNIK